MNIFNEALKGDRKFAKQVLNTYREITKELNQKAVSGDRKASVEFMLKLAEENVVLYHLGFRISDKGRLCKL